MNVGMRIKQLRQERGWSQSELGEKLGVKKAAVQKWESGHVQNLKNSTIRQLCELFRKSPSFFIFDDHELMCDERISDGLGFGIISYMVLNCGIKGRFSWLMFVLSLLFIAKYIFL